MGFSRIEFFQTLEAPLTDESKQALLFAREEAVRLGHDEIGTAHLFLGLLRQGALADLTVDLEEAREAVSKNHPSVQPTEVVVVSGAVEAVVKNATEAHVGNRISPQELRKMLGAMNIGLIVGVLNSLGITKEQFSAPNY